MFKKMATYAVCVIAAMGIGLVAINTAEGRADEPADMSKPVQVFILMGQSNMFGFGRINPDDQEGTLAHAVQNKDKYQNLVDDEGNWIERKDVRYVQVMNERTMRNEWLVPKGRHIGPELGFGHVIGDKLDEPVLIIKSCIGNRSLGWDLLPPGSEQFEYNGKIYAGYKDSPSSWEKGTEPEPIGWYAGKQYDSDVAAAKRVLENLKEFYPDAENYEVAGFLWWQGHKDGGNAAHISRYEHNLVNLIKQLRKDFDAPDAKFALATVAFSGENMGENYVKIAEAQLAVSGEKGKYPEFKGNVKAFDARPLWRDSAVSPTGAGYHYNHNAETYMDVGNAFGESMAELLDK